MNDIEPSNLLQENSELLSLNINENYETNAGLSSINNQLLFIDSTVKDYQLLIDNLTEEVEIIIVDNKNDGIFQIAETLSQYDSLDAVHIVSHGNSGELFLGNTILNQDNLTEYQDELNDWGNAIEEEGDILLYGCNVALGEYGSHFIEELSQVTDADILASIDNTGKDGDWELEAKVGEVETISIFDSNIHSTYRHNLQFSDTISTGGGGGGDFDDPDDDFDDFEDFLDDELSGGGSDNDDDDNEVDASDFDSFADVLANSLAGLAENGLNFAEVSPDVLATIDFNNIPVEDFQTLRNAGLSLNPLSPEVLANIILGVFEGFDYLPQVDLSQTRLDNLTLFGELSTTFVSNANLYDYKSELDIDLGLNLNNIVQLSTSDFRAIDYAFEGDELFDLAHYRAQASIPVGVNPYTDYVENGWRDELDPNPLFDTEFYFATHTDVRDEVLAGNSNANPLQHYLEFGGEGKFATENRITHPIIEGDYLVAYSTFIDGDSVGVPVAQQEFGKLNFELTPREQGGILVASPTLAGPLVLKGIEYAVYTGIAYEIADQLDLPEGVFSLYQSFTQTSLYESFTIRLNDLFTGTPPFPDDAIESTPEIETFPRGNTLQNILDLDGRFYTPLDPIDELANNVDSFPLRDEILESLLNDGLFVGGQETPQGSYVLAADLSGGYGAYSPLEITNVSNNNWDSIIEGEYQTNEIFEGLETPIRETLPLRFDIDGIKIEQQTHGQYIPAGLDMLNGTNLGTRFVSGRADVSEQVRQQILVGTNITFSPFEGEQITTDGGITFRPILPSEVTVGVGQALLHVEGHAASSMRLLNSAVGSIIINNVNGPCEGCIHGLPRILPDGATLAVLYENALGEIVRDIFVGGKIFDREADRSILN